ncbi:MAG: hypothetical protein IT222_04365 [Crocinitomix sp.]|nr:hypothetical protein [Crocinitomix sp.]
MTIKVANIRLFSAWMISIIIHVTACFTLGCKNSDQPKDQPPIVGVQENLISNDCIVVNLADTIFKSDENEREVVDTEFISRELSEENYFAIFIERNKKSKYYKWLTNFKIDNFEELNFNFWKEQLNPDFTKNKHDYKFPPELPRKWCDLNIYKDAYYLYAPCDWGFDSRVLFTDSLLIEFNMDDPFGGFILNVRKLDNNTYEFLLQDSSNEPSLLTVHMIDWNNQIAIFDNHHQNENYRYSLKIGASKAKNFPIIVNYSKYQKNHEFQFDAIDFISLLAKKSPTSKEKIELTTFKDSIRFIEECRKDEFIYTINYNITQNTNAVIVSVQSLNGGDKKLERLNLNPDLTHIERCTDSYTVINGSCGGPCSVRYYVFTEKDKPTEVYYYSDYVSNDSTFLTHIRDEIFESLLVRNLENGKELIVDMSDADPEYFGNIDSMYFERGELVLYFPTRDLKSGRKVVNLGPILN